MSEVIWSHYSESLGRETSLRIYFPDSQHESTPIESLDKTEYLLALHGLGGNSRQLNSYLPLEYLSSKFNTTVIVPDGYRSFYTNNNEEIEKYLCKELPEKLNKYFTIPHPKDHKWNITGISMGGFGSIYLSSKYKNLFNKICPISSALSRDLLIDGSEDEDFILEHEKTKDWPWKKDQSHENVNFDANQKILILCGKEDPFYKDNEDFVKNNPNINSYFEGGDHSWIYWQKAIIRSFKFIRDLDYKDLSL